MAEDTRATVEEVLNIKAKKNALTLDEVDATLKKAQANPLIMADPNLAATVNTLVFSIATYRTTIDLINTLTDALAAAKLASKAALALATPETAPTITAEIQADIAAKVQVASAEAANRARIEALNSLYRQRVPGTEGFGG